MRNELKLWLRALVIVIVGVPLWSLASNLTVPNSFTPDTTILSAQVNANFAAVQTAVNSKQDAISGSCPAGQAISAIGADGGADGGALTCVASGLEFGANVTGSLNGGQGQDGLGPGLIVSNTGTGAGIVGESLSQGYAYAVGVEGQANDGIGSWGYSYTGIGVYGSTSACSQPAIQAYSECPNLPTGIALSIQRGYFQVLDAGANTSTTAFTWTATAASISGDQTTIDNPMTNGNPNLLLIVTQNSSSGIVNAHPVGITYNGAKWAILNQDTGTMTANATFNVLVISP